MRPATTLLGVCFMVFLCVNAVTNIKLVCRRCHIHLDGRYRQLIKAQTA